MDARAPGGAGGLIEGALEHGRDLLRRWEESEDRHYSLNALGWLSGLFAEHRQEADLQRVVRALGAIAEENGNREALAMLARALGELAQVHGDAAARSPISSARSTCTRSSSSRTIARSCS